MSTNMADDVVIEVSHHSNLPLSVPTPTQSRPCCDSHSHEHSDVKVPTIFDAVKSGFVVSEIIIVTQGPFGVKLTYECSVRGTAYNAHRRRQLV